ncbi:MAG: LysM peptidoglycan-binding domain-containing protein [Waddliaceae bacterium]
MSRKDTLISAILINMALLGFLFILAVPVQEIQLDSNSMVQEVAISSPTIEEIQKPQVISESPKVQEPEVLVASSSYDELDELLSQFKKPDAPKPETPREKPVEKVKTQAPADAFQLVTVNDGDYLGKIAKKHGTTVARIKALNAMTSENIRVGQQIKVPTSSSKITEEQEEYYTLKNGDNPWKISKQFNVPFYKLLEINNLDQENALRLKPGDKLRVR